MHRHGRHDRHLLGRLQRLQVAARRPPALKAIITVCSTDDRYADDIHYMGGCLLIDNLALGVGDVRLHRRGRPTRRSSASAGARCGCERLERHAALVDNWLRPPAPRRLLAAWLGLRGLRRDRMRRSIAVGGWADGYTNAIPRLLAGLQAPRKGLIGPVGARSTRTSRGPGPQIGFLQEALRWWDHWLKGIDTGIMDEPLLRPGCRTAVPPQPPTTPSGPGAGSPRTTGPRRASRCSAGAEPGTARAAAGAPRAALTIALAADGSASPPASGAAYGLPGDLPADQRVDDGGVARLRHRAARRARWRSWARRSSTLELSADRPHAFVVARLCDVAPDGAATRVSYGVLNLTHRDSHAEPAPLEPGAALRGRASSSTTSPTPSRPATAPARALQRLLADDLALARAGDADLLGGASRARAAGAAAAPRGRRAARRSPSPRRRRPGGARSWCRARSARRVERDVLAGTTTTTVENDEGV